MAAPLNVLVLNGSLKHGPAVSNTEETTNWVLDEMKKLADISAETVRLADKDIPVGLGFKESETDEWPAIVEKLKAADVVIFATPIWWGNRSSLMQRTIERLDALDEEYIATGRSVLLNKVAGIVITGSEDGAQNVMAHLMEVLSFMNFTLPPQCCTYWVGEVGGKDEAEKRRENESVKHMAAKTAKSLVYYAELLRERPMSA
jgi:multimeric flavodoxin WrbA